MAGFTNGMATLPQYGSMGSTPGANAPASIPGSTPAGGGISNESNQMFGSPGALTSGAAGKTGITSGPQLSLGAKGGSSLPSNASSMANGVTGSLPGAAGKL